MMPPRVKVSGIEALVCADIAQRQQLGIRKYGTTVAQNPLSLRQWYEHHYQELLDAAVYTRRIMADLDKVATDQAKQQAAQPKPQSTWRGRPVATYEYKGQRMTVAQLAQMAGCAWNCMRSRLQTRSPGVAVRMGGPGSRGRKDGRARPNAELWRA